jgi:hypothetical protein
MKKILKCSDNYFQHSLFCRDVQFGRLFLFYVQRFLKLPFLFQGGVPEGRGGSYLSYFPETLPNVKKPSEGMAVLFCYDKFPTPRKSTPAHNPIYIHSRSKSRQAHYILQTIQETALIHALAAHVCDLQAVFSVPVV